MYLDCTSLYNVVEIISIDYYRVCDVDGKRHLGFC